VKQVKARPDARARYLQMTREWPRLLNEEETIRIARDERELTRAATARACGDDRDQCAMASPAVQEKARRMTSEFHRASMVTMSSVHAMASALARVPGPKAVIFVSEGFTAQDLEPLRTVTGQLARVGARLYAIDIGGLDRRDGGTTVEQMPSVHESAAVATRVDQLADVPNSLAMDTGGLMIRNENNIGRALEQISSDTATYYVLTYQPSDPTFDGKFRTIQVKAKRDGVRVRARRGYLALEPSKMVIPQPIK
jgi:VWFA-related protein